MIKAKFNSQKNLITGFTLSGHADSGEYGHDIVCAAVSVLSTPQRNWYKSGKFSLKRLPE